MSATLNSATLAAIMFTGAIGWNAAACNRARGWR